MIACEVLERMLEHNANAQKNVYRFQALKHNGTLMDVTRFIDFYWKANNKALI